MRVSKNIYKKEDMTWQIIRDFLLDVTDSNGIVDKGVVKTAKRHKLYRWAKVSLIIKRGDKIFNGQSDVHINIMAKNYFEKYINFKYPPHRAYNEIGQTTLPFASRPKIGCKLTPPPHIIKDAMKGTVTVVPQGKEKEFIESTKVAQPQQRREFSFGWGLLTIKF